MRIIDRESAPGPKKEFGALLPIRKDEPLDEEGGNDGVPWSSAINVSDEVEAIVERPNEREGGRLAVEVAVAAAPNGSVVISPLC